MQTGGKDADDRKCKNIVARTKPWTFGQNRNDAAAKDRRILGTSGMLLNL